jgi:FixJ family two-component response regulator
VNETPTVFLVDDDPAVLGALSRLLRSAGHPVASFASAADFLASGLDTAPGCLLLDVSMPGLSGVALQQLLAERHSTLPVIFLTGHGDIDMGVQAMKAGATDFLTKPVDASQLLAAVQAAIAQNRSRRQARAILDEIAQRIASLTPREREVLPLVVSGRLNKQIASDLGTVEKTVKVHRARVMAKMGVHSLADLVRLADRAGIDGHATTPG